MYPATETVSSAPLIGSVIFSRRYQLGVITPNVHIDNHISVKSILTRRVWPLAPQVASLSDCYNVTYLNFKEKGYPCVTEKLNCLVSSLAEPRPVKWQGLNVSRRPTDGQQSPNPGEEALWYNKVQNSYRGQLLFWCSSTMKPVYMSFLNSTRGHLMFRSRCSILS